MKKFKNEAELINNMLRVDAMLDDFGHGDAATHDRVAEIVQVLLAFHTEGLKRMLEHIRGAGSVGADTVAGLARDELVCSMLCLHGLHPMALGDRVRQLFSEIEPHLAKHGGHCELLGVTEDGAVSLRFEGQCQSCGSSQAGLKDFVEEAIYAVAPEVSSIDVQGLNVGTADLEIRTAGGPSSAATGSFCAGCAVTQGKEQS